MTPLQFKDALERLDINQRQLSALFRVGQRTAERYVAEGPSWWTERMLEFLLQGKITVDDLARPALKGDDLKTARSSDSSAPPPPARSSTPHSAETGTA